MRITNQQITHLRSIVIEYDLDPQLFEFTKIEEDSLKIKLKADYFSFEFKKVKNDEYYVTLFSIHSTKSGSFSCNWNLLTKVQFKLWLEQVKGEIESDLDWKTPLSETTKNSSQTYPIVVTPECDIVKLGQTKTEEKGINVFIVYSWDSEEHKTKVLEFCQYLRDKGFNAEIDRLKSQEETATDFSKMMHSGITSYSKVIIILSKGYKEKAEKFKGGVGNEYQMIIKDFEDNNKKYVICSFGPPSKESTPLFLQQREAINVNSETEHNTLFSKLKDEPTLEFNPVAYSTPSIVKTPISEFIPEKGKLEISAFNLSSGGNSSFANRFRYVRYNIDIELENYSSNTIDDVSIDVTYPLNTVKDIKDGIIDLNNYTYTIDSGEKFQSGRKRKYNLKSIEIDHRHADIILDKEIIIKLYYNNKSFSKSYKIKELAEVSSNGIVKTLELEDFLPKHHN